VSRGLYSLRLSRFAASRLKRLSLTTRRRGLVRIFIGAVYTLSKLGQNARMGKGRGSYFTTRRLIHPGFTWIAARGPLFPALRRLQHYLRARWGGHVRLIEGAAWLLHQQRVATSWVQTVRDHTGALQRTYKPRRREFYYRRWRSRLTARWRRLYLGRGVRVLRRIWALLQVKSRPIYTSTKFVS
jgi:hypothetical protein